jgi:protein gp37
MSNKTGIEYADSTWNIVTGCSPKSEGCAACWARDLHNLRHRAFLDGKKLPAQYAVPFSQVQLLPERLEQPLHWKKPRRIFVASTGDLWHDEVPFSYINRVFDVMERAAWHVFQVLTKRPERMAMWARQRSKPIPSNVWGGVSVENQAAADERIPLLVGVGFALKFVSCEPLLGKVDLQLRGRNFGRGEEFVNWVICGGESGSDARPMYAGWARYLLHQCEEAGVPFYFKQWGEWCQGNQSQIQNVFGRKIHRWEDNSCSLWVGKERAGHLLDGEEWRQVP